MVDRLQGISSSCTVKLRRKHFMRYGIPEVISNRGLEFDNQMMREQAHKYGFKRNPSSPEMLNSNEMVESAVKQIKYIIRKCNNENSDPCQAILEFTNTPSKSTGMSPGQRFLGRKLRSVFNAEETKTKIRKAKTITKETLWQKRSWPDRIIKGWLCRNMARTNIRTRWLSQKSLNTGDTWSN